MTATANDRREPTVEEMAFVVQRTLANLQPEERFAVELRAWIE